MGRLNSLRNALVSGYQVNLPALRTNVWVRSTSSSTEAVLAALKGALIGKEFCEIFCNGNFTPKQNQKHRKNVLAQTLSPVSLHSTSLRAAMIRSRSTCRCTGFTTVPQRSALNLNPGCPEGYRLQGLCQGAYSHCCFPGEAKASYSTILNLSQLVIYSLYSLYLEGCPAEAKPEANGKYSLAPYLTGHWKCQKHEEFEEFSVSCGLFPGRKWRSPPGAATKVMELTARNLFKIYIVYVNSWTSV